MPVGSLLACTAAGAGQPHRPHRIQPRAAEDHAGGDHAVGVRAVRNDLYGPAVQTRLRVGRNVPDGRGVLHFPVIAGFEGHNRQDFELGITLRPLTN